MPRAPPLINATFPASLMMGLLSTWGPTTGGPQTPFNMGPHNRRTPNPFQHGAPQLEDPKPLLVGEDDGKAALVAEHDDLRVRALRQLVGDLDRLPLQELRADALGDDRLEVRDALGLDALAIRLLPLTVEHEAHPLRLLLGLKLLLDR